MTVRVGLLGCGTVGSGAARALALGAADIRMAVGAPVEITRVAVRDPSCPRNVPLAPELFTEDAAGVARDPNVDLVVEAIGGSEPARTLILSALEAGKPVVTANKELVSTSGAELFAAAESRGVDLYYEAAVCGGIPLIRPLKESLAGERIRRVTGIVNGTTNYILSRMSELGLRFDEALAEAGALGYAEADPTADIEGHDAAAKAAILASVAFRARVVQSDVYREGISRISHQDIQYAHRLGYEVKLLAIAEEQDGQVSARVYPAMIPSRHPLASVRDSYNAVFVEGESVGELMFYGPGAGSDPTGSAIVGDVIAAARHLVSGGRGMEGSRVQPKPIRPISQMRAQYYVLLSVEDRPGALAAVAGAFAYNDVSIRTVWQEGSGSEAQLVLVTHRALESALQATVSALETLDLVSKVVSVLRVEAQEGD